MKKTIRLTESELKHLIRESVKRVLRESIQDTIQSLSQELGCNPNNIRQEDKYHFYVNGVEYLVFDSVDEARNYVLNEFGTVEGDAPLDYFIQNAKAAGANMNVLFPNGQPDWGKITEFILDIRGPEWFLAGYDGEAICLNNGQVAYRYD